MIRHSSGPSCRPGANSQKVGKPKLIPEHPSRGGAGKQLLPRWMESVLSGLQQSGVRPLCPYALDLMMKFGGNLAHHDSSLMHDIYEEGKHKDWSKFSYLSLIDIVMGASEVNTDLYLDGTFGLFVTYPGKTYIENTVMSLEANSSTLAYK
ncbi:hypothetical protein FF38_14154 [Lucilia cuprina]|uniref:Uncharacterized protein n=1 Tax=Lucilia cuprina TaxID=7375 RepID=A0A0L0BVA5_LUCCU|nr:hypothetical protein FF38_14154 [Lucilia cuprina]